MTDLKVNINTHDPVKAFFEIMSPIFKLTPKEIDILVAMYQVDPQQPVRKDTKSKVSDSLGFKNKNVLTTYISDFSKRDVLKKDAKGIYRFHPLLQKPLDLKTLTFHIGNS